VTSPEVPVDPSLDAPAQKPERPGLRLLLWYSLGGSLPARYNTWVLHDVTCRTWWVRHFARVFAIITPPLAAFFLLLVPPFGAPAAFAGICLAGTLFLAGMIYILIDSDRRAVRAGYPTDYAAGLRSRRATETQHNSNYERRERIAARRDKRAGKR
jgi:hypothetical protein